MLNYLNNITISPDLLLKFFLMFSRFEYALKASGFLIGDNKKANADWDGFAHSIQNSFEFNKNLALRKACDAFIVNPPWKEVVIDGKLYWDASVSERNLEGINDILLMVRRVRNNLFHGAKFNSGVMPDLDRNRRLIESAILVLEECLSLSPDVKKHYDDATL